MKQAGNILRDSYVASEDIRGVYDPPYPLHATTAAATPTPANSVGPNNAASLASAPKASQALQTSELIGHPNSHDPNTADTAGRTPPMNVLGTSSSHDDSLSERPSKGGSAADPSKSTPTLNPVGLDLLSDFLFATGRDQDLSEGQRSGVESSWTPAQAFAAPAKNDPEEGRRIRTGSSGMGSRPATGGISRQDESLKSENNSDQLDPNGPGSMRKEKGSAVDVGIVKSGRKSLGVLAPPVNFVTSGGQPVAEGPENSNGFSVGTQRLGKGQAAANIAGRPISIGPSGVVIEKTSTIPLKSIFTAAEAPNIAVPIIIGGHSLSKYPTNTDVIVTEGTRLTIPEQPANVVGTQTTVGPDGVAVSTNIPTPLPLQSAEGDLLGVAIASVNGEMTNADLSDPRTINLGDIQTLRPGQPADVDGTPVSVGPDGSAIGTSSDALTILGPLGVAAIGSQNLSIYRSAETISGEVISFAVSGLSIKNHGPTNSYRSPDIVSGSESTRSADFTATEASFTISGHQFSAYVVSSSDGNAIILGTSGHPITTLVEGAVLTLVG